MRGKRSAGRAEGSDLSQYPEGLASDLLARLQQLTSNSENEIQKRLEQQRAAHPDGTVTLPHARIRQAEYAPLLSGHGDPLGVRVRYTITFSEDGYYQASPYVSPVFRNSELRGAVGLRLLDARLEPGPPADPRGQAVLALQISRWQAIEANAEPLPYSVIVFDFGFSATTGDLPPVGVFHQNFIKEGAEPCGPTPKRNF